MTEEEYWKLREQAEILKSKGFFTNVPLDELIERIRTSTYKKDPSERTELAK